MTAAVRHVRVVVPARDEQDEIGGCLDSIERACAALLGARGVPSQVVVVLDDCHDATEAVVGDYPGVEVRRSFVGSVGIARAEGARLLPDRADHWLASTDADSRVPDDWLVRMIAHADAGADVVLGTVRPASGLTAAVARVWFEAHELGDGHPHVHGANLGIRADRYLALGGWGPLFHDEDVDLVARAVEAGLAITRAGDVVVGTSSRTVGRTPDGFARYLRDLRPSEEQLSEGA